MSWFNPFEGKTNGGGGGGSGTTDYGALQNKPQINGIMLNGNLSTSDLHIDIPTTAVEVGAMPNTTKYAASIDLSINNSTYVMTAQLKDQDGNNIGSSDSIDLPLETMVVNGQYDDETKKIVLTLKSGDTIEFSVADLISGLQVEITSKNKLSADLIQDGNTNKVVTLSEKNTWNSKQNAITAQAKLSADLIQDGNVNKTVTASEKTNWGNKQSAITSESKLSSDLVDDTNNTHLFVSSSEKSTWTGKQNAITLQNKLNADFVDDTNSTNKFVSSSDISNWNGKLSSIPIASEDTLGGVKIGSGIHLEEDGTISVTGGGGGGETTDYRDLDYKPQINGITLTGNKSGSTLGLASTADVAAKADAATTLAGYGITDAKISNGAITLGSNTITPLTQHQDISGKADKATSLAGYGITDAKITNGTITLGNQTITPLTQHQDISGKADKATTIAGYGITDAKIVNGVITLGNNTITPLTQHQDISGKADKATTIADYGITDAKIQSGTITLGSQSITPLTQHQDISGKADKATSLAGYGITDAKITNGTITLGNQTITPLTQHQDISGKADKATTLSGYGITDAKIQSGTITLGSQTITPITQIPIASSSVLGGVKIGSGISVASDGTISASGSGGTSNYSELSNKPQINSTTLTGNKSSSDLGLQSAITSSAKLSADVVDDTSTTHKFVTASDKTTWSGKQDAITDLTTIRSGADAGATAVQTIQIDGTVQTKTAGIVNLPAYPTTLPASDTVSTYSSTGTAPVNGKAVKAALETLDVSSVGGAGKYINAISESNGKIAATSTGFDSTPTSGSTYGVSSGGVYTALSGKVDKVSGKGLSTNDYTTAEKQKLAGLSNYDDSVLTAEAAAIVNAGAKNMLTLNLSSTSSSGVNLTVNTDGTITSTGGTSSSYAAFILNNNVVLPVGDYILSGCPSGGADGTYRIDISGTQYYDTGSGVQFTSTGAAITVRIRIGANTNVNNLVWKPMIRNAAIVDNTFQQYAPTNRQLYEMILALQAQMQQGT